jgi:hypothetical protein
MPTGAGVKRHIIRGGHMDTIPARSIFEAAERAIYELVVDGKASATLQGRSYTAANLADLERVRDYYRAQAVANGELNENATTQRVVVSVASITEN